MPHGKKKGMKKGAARRVARGLALRMLGELQCDTCRKVFSKPAKLKAHFAESVPCQPEADNALRALTQKRDAVAREVRRSYSEVDGIGGAAGVMERALAAAEAVEAREAGDYRDAGAVGSCDESSSVGSTEELTQYTAAAHHSPAGRAPASLSPSLLLWDASGGCPSPPPPVLCSAPRGGDAAHTVLRFGARRLKVRDVAARRDAPEGVLHMPPAAYQL
eukprot:TRINITY_DN30899_c0_g1_i1.p1 TRINITY_DN30899_c0_g1~~TRINITY_DN30899_c0_g1_i1.p1  ORF type:complete len:219 (+),score=75.96 TRINITY_DN30899_c0_g1_i1:102-758(+)